MARRLIFYLVRDEDNVCLEISEFMRDCFDARIKNKLTRANSHIEHEWVNCGGYEK